MATMIQWWMSGIVYTSRRRYLFMSGIFDLFDRHFDVQNACATDFAHQSVCHYWHNVKQTFITQSNVGYSSVLMDLKRINSIILFPKMIKLRTTNF